MPQSFDFQKKIGVVDPPLAYVPSYTYERSIPSDIGGVHDTATYGSTFVEPTYVEWTDPAELNGSQQPVMRESIGMCILYVRPSRLHLMLYDSREIQLTCWYAGE